MKLDTRRVQQEQNGFRPYQWEYRSATMERDADLSQFGAEGWELVSVAAHPGDMAQFWFKRRKA